MALLPDARNFEDISSLIYSIIPPPLESWSNLYKEK